MRTKGQRRIGPHVETREAVGWGCLMIYGLSLCSSFTGSGDLDGWADLLKKSQLVAVEGKGRRRMRRAMRIADWLVRRGHQVVFAGISFEKCC